MAKQHLVKCKICGESFDAAKIQAVKCGSRRYAHYECYPEGELVPLEVSTEDPDLIKLKDYINKLYSNKANWALINKQIKQFQKENNYTLSGILKSLIYFYEVQGNSVDRSNGGIGIVPFVYQAAYNYYYNLFITLEANKDKTLFTQIKEIIIRPPQSRGSKQKFFNLEKREE